MDYSVKEKVVIVTGGTKGMGWAIAQKFLDLGAKVALIYASDTKHANQLEEQLNSPAALFLQGDITDPTAREQILNETLHAFGQIDILVNNAGIPSKTSFLKESTADFDRVIDVNLKAPLYLSQLIAKQMIEQKKGGAIINISSVCGHRGMGGVAYDAAKAGLIRATQSMANALGKYGIRVNSISPGMHKTEMNRVQWENNTELYQGMCAVTSLKRAGEAEEIAGTVLYLASDQSSYTTGADIIVDGGYLIHAPGR